MVLIPEGAERLQNFHQIGKAAAEVGGYKSHLFVPTCLLGESLFALMHTPRYALEMGMRLSIASLTCGRCCSFSSAGRAALNTLKSLALAVCSVALACLAIVAPKLAYKILDPSDPKPSEDPVPPSSLIESQNLGGSSALAFGPPACLSPERTSTPMHIRQNPDEEQSPGVEDSLPSESLPGVGASLPLDSYLQEDVFEGAPEQSRLLPRPSEGPVNLQQEVSQAKFQGSVAKIGGGNRPSAFQPLQRPALERQGDESGQEREALDRLAGDRHVTSARDQVSSPAAVAGPSGVQHEYLDGLEELEERALGEILDAYKEALERKSCEGQKRAGAFFNTEHPSKEMKYRLQMEQIATQLEMEINEDGQSLLSDATEKGSLQYHRVLEILFMPLDPQGEYDNPRGQYQLFIQELDKWISSPEYQSLYENDKRIQVTRAICFIRWNQVEMTGYYDSLLQMMMFSERASEEGASSSNSTSFAERISLVNQKIHERVSLVGKSKIANAWQKLGAVTGLEYLTGRKNPPNVISINMLNGIRYVQVRAACPTVPQGTFNRVRSLFSTQKRVEPLAPNFVEMVKSLAKEEKSALIISLQNPETENEAARIRGLEEGEEEIENFHVLHQSLDFPLFKKGIGSQGNKVETFTELIEEITKAYQDKDSKWLKLPRVLRSQEEVFNYHVGAFIPLLLRQIHALFFNGDEQLEERDRKAFFLLFYTLEQREIIKKIAEITGRPPFFVANPCKDNLDRGGSKNFVEKLADGFLSGEFEDPIWRKNVMALTLAPPIAVKKQAILPDRIDPAIRVCEILENLMEFPDRVEAIRRFMEFEKLSLKDKQIPHSLLQFGLPVGPNIQTQKELEEFIILNEKLGVFEIELSQECCEILANPEVQEELIKNLLESLFVSPRLNLSIKRIEGQDVYLWKQEEKILGSISFSAHENKIGWNLEQGEIAQLSPVR